jgi:hypothetical protein
VIGGIFTAVLLVAALRPVWAMRNKGWNTTCPHFLKMSHEQRANVVEKMGFATSSREGDQILAEAVSGCQQAQGTSDADDELQYILGP